MFMWTLFVSLTVATAEIIDYSHSNYFPIPDGNAVLWSSYGYMKHLINLTQYSVLIDESYDLLHVLPKSEVTRLLEADLDHIQHLLLTLHNQHRPTRSLHFLGTGLKIIAGTPDFDDFENAKLKIEELIDANNQQAKVNFELENQINNLTSTVNKILKKAKTDIIDHGQLFELFLARNRAVIIQLNNIVLSITLAKIGLLNPLLLDNDEINAFIKDDRFADITISDLLMVSKFKVLKNDAYIIYLIKYPKPMLVCKKLRVFPVVHNNTILHLSAPDVAVCNGQSFGVNNCVETPGGKFCELSTKSNCAQQLTSGVVAHCESTFNRLDPINEVDDGVIIINDCSAEVTISKKTYQLTRGTYVITFEGQAFINSSEFYNRNSLPAIVAETPLHTEINLTGYTELLSLPYLQHHYLLNRQTISSLNESVEMRSTRTEVTVVGVLLIAILICAAFLIVRRKKKRNSAKVLEQEVLTRINERLCLQGREALPSS